MMTKNKDQRFCLEQDESSHWYCIPENLREEFEKLLEAAGDWPPDYNAVNRFEERFGEYRLGMHPSNHTFTDWQEI